jgi:divalent metal cation (Fe/Co/Zn/Cd) transporter
MYSSKLSLTPEKRKNMNIKVKAALEVAGGIVAMVAIATGVRTILNELSAVYGPEQVVNGIILTVVGVTAYVMVGLLYDIRVSQLKYKEKLEEMVKK